MSFRCFFLFLNLPKFAKQCEIGCSFLDISKFQLAYMTVFKISIPEKKKILFVKSTLIRKHMDAICIDTILNRIVKFIDVFKVYSRCFLKFNYTVTGKEIFVE